ILLFTVFDDLVAFLEQSSHTLAWLRFGLSTKQREAFFQAFDLPLGFLEVGLEGELQAIGVGGFRDLRQRLYKLTLGAEQVAQLLHQKLLDQVRFACSARRSIVDPCGRRDVCSARSGILKRWGLDELPIGALVPWTARINLAVFTLPGRVVEELIHESGRRRYLSDREAGLVQTLERRRARLHVGNFACHQALQ